MLRISAYALLGAALSLVVLGVVMLYSTGAFSETSAAYGLVSKQGMWLVLAVIACFLVARQDYQELNRWVTWVYAGAIVLLALCYLPGIGAERGGANRWLDLKIGLLQPSEFAKIAVIAGLAVYYSRKAGEEGDLTKGFIVPLAIVALPALLIVLQVDLGAAVLVGVVGLAVMFVAGARALYLTVVSTLGLTAVVAAVLMMPNRLARLTAFMDLEAHRFDFGLQQWRALLAFGTGGPWGLGLGNGRQKMAYMPEAHTDFIFPMVGEELGLRVTILVVVAFAVITVAGCLISARAPDRLGRLLGFGVTALLATQAFINIGVTTAVLPNKGMPLPFVSYGGSNLLACFLIIGILLSIHRAALAPVQVRTQVPRGEAGTTMRA